MLDVFRAPGHKFNKPSTLDNNIRMIHGTIWGWEKGEEEEKNRKEKDQ